MLTQRHTKYVVGTKRGMWKMGGLFLVAAGLVFAGWVYKRGQSELSLTGHLPKGYTVIYAENLKPPIIDFSLPIVGHIVYPARAKPINRFDPATMAGAVMPSLGGNSAENIYYTWIIDKERIEGFANENEPVFIPRVYGSEPIQATLKIANCAPVSIRLPATGEVEPSAYPQVIKLKGGEMTCTPRRLISPFFPIRYDVTFKGAGTRFVRFESERGRSLPVYEGMSDSQIWVHPKTLHQLVLVEENVREIAAKADTYVTPPLVAISFNAMLSGVIGLSIDKENKNAEGQVWIRDGVPTLTTSYISNLEGNFMGDAADTFISAGSVWFGCDRILELSDKRSWPGLRGYPFPALKNGQKVDVKIYRVIGDGEVSHPVSELSAIKRFAP